MEMAAQGEGGASIQLLVANLLKAFGETRNVSVLHRCPDPGPLLERRSLPEMTWVNANKFAQIDA